MGIPLASKEHNFCRGNQGIVLIRYTLNDVNCSELIIISRQLPKTIMKIHQKLFCVTHPLLICHILLLQAFKLEGHSSVLWSRPSQWLHSLDWFSVVFQSKSTIIRCIHLLILIYWHHITLHRFILKEFTQISNTIFNSSLYSMFKC